MNTAQALPDAEVTASIVGTPRLNTPFQIDFGFINRGNSNAVLNVKVTNTVPAEFTVISYAALTGEGATCANHGNEIVCTFPSTPPAASALASVTVQSPVAGMFSNRTAMSRVLGDFNRTNDTLVTAITIEPPPSADLELIFWEATGRRLGEEFTIALTVGNNGPNPVFNVMLTNRLPAGTTLRFSGDLAGEGDCVETNGELICAINAIPPGFGWGVFLHGRTLGGGLHTNYISVGSELPDLNPANNHYDAVFSVAPPLAAAVPVVVREDALNAFIQVSLSIPSPDPVSVDYHTRGGTALEGVDFAPTHGTLVFPPGVTNLTLQVPLLQDSLYEGPEQFSLIISNAFGNHLAVPPAEVTITNDDPPPVITVNDVTLVEGDENTVRDLTFTLSTTSALPVVVWWGTADGTALASQDYFPASNYVYFFPGESSLTLQILFIRGNTTFEPEETFRIQLGTTVGATLARTQAVVTIVDDDAVPGRLDHFVFAPVPSPRIANLPFPITVQAVDAFGSVVTSFADSIQSVFSGANLIVPLVRTNFVNGTWTGLVAVTGAATNAFLLANDGNEHGGTSNPFRSLLNPPIRVTVPANTIEGAGTLDKAGTVAIDFTYDEDIVFTLSSANTNVARVPASVVLNAGETNAAFDLIVHDDALLDGTSGANITAGAQGFASGSMVVRVHDNETAVLGLNLPTSLTEGSQNVQVTLSVSAPPDTNVVVTLSSTASTRLQMPTAVSISSGQTSRVFTANVMDDKILQGPQAIELRAHVENWTDGIGITTLVDNESTNMTLAWRSVEAPFLIEGQGTLSNALVLNFGGALISNLVVTLSSGDPTEITVPATVTNLAGTGSVNIPITVMDDSEFDGLQTATITASAVGFGSGNRVAMVSDNDAHHLVVSVQGPPTAGYPISGVPFSVSVLSRDVNDQPITVPFDSPLVLALSGPSGPLGLTPANIVSGQRGSWFQAVTALNWSSNVVLTATTTNGVTGQSNPFVIRPPSWSTNLSLIRAEIAGNDVHLHITSRPGYRYQIEYSDTFPATEWAPIGPTVAATTDLLVITDAGGAIGPGRFYRLMLLP